MLSIPFDKPDRPSFDLAGVTSFIGGDFAVSTMIAVYVYGKTPWLGGYNTPGSLQVAMRLDSFAKFSSFNYHSTDEHVRVIDLAALLEPDRSKGPKFFDARSGTIIEETGYLATLFMKECAAQGLGGRKVRPKARITQPVEVTIADLSHTPDYEMSPAHSGTFTSLFAIFAILVSVGACSTCVICKDWYASSLIFIGIAASGLSGLVFGSANFAFTHPKPADESVDGDGVLSSGNTIILLRGKECAVNSITCGSFSLRFSNVIHFNLIRRCSLLFFVQFFTQVFFIPQASWFGQVIFLTSLGVSALHNVWLCSLDKETVHRKLLFKQVLEEPTLTKYKLGTRTAAVVFVLLVLRLKEPSELLNELLPNKTKVWEHWKEMILEWLRRPNDQPIQHGTWKDFSPKEQEVLEQLYGDAYSAYQDYNEYIQRPSCTA